MLCVVLAGSGLARFEQSLDGPWDGHVFTLVHSTDWCYALALKPDSYTLGSGGLGEVGSEAPKPVLAGLAGEALRTLHDNLCSVILVPSS